MLFTNFLPKRNHYKSLYLNYTALAHFSIFYQILFFLIFRLGCFSPWGERSPHVQVGQHEAFSIDQLSTPIALSDTIYIKC